MSARDPLAIEMEGLRGAVERIIAERDLLRERERELVEALAGVLSIEDTVTRGQESERRAEWLPKARAVLAKHGR